MSAMGTGRSLSSGRAKRGPVGRCDKRIGERHFMEVLILNRGTLRRIIAHAGLIVSEFEFFAVYRMPRSADSWTLRK